MTSKCKGGRGGVFTFCHYSSEHHKRTRGYRLMAASQANPGLSLHVRAYCESDICFSIYSVLFFLLYTRPNIDLYSLGALVLIISCDNSDKEEMFEYLPFGLKIVNGKPLIDKDNDDGGHMSPITA